MSAEPLDLKSLVRTIPDYPKPGIMFRDITTLISDGAGFGETVHRIAGAFRGQNIQAVAGIEARGFIFGAAVAAALGTGFVPIRKKGKLPYSTIHQEYELEYGTDVVEMHADAVHANQRVLLVDDLIATGGTAEAAVKLLRRGGAEVVAAAFVIDLPELGGIARLKALGVDSVALIAFDGH